LACASVAFSDEPSASLKSTISSTRVDDGKNCCGTKRNANTDATNKAIVTTITIQRCRTHQSTSLRTRW
jgi:hypothetical protein